MGWRSLSLGFALGVAVSVTGISWMSSAQAGPTLGRKSFHAAVDAVLRRYVDPVEPGNLMASGLKHMVSGLDPYSHYLTADERRLLRSKDRRGQIGIALAFHHGDRPGWHTPWLEITSVMPGSPADSRGLRAGDHILGIRGRDVAFLLSQAEAEALLRGKPGETVSLTVQRVRDPGPVSLTLTLEDVSTDLVISRIVEAKGRKVGYVQVRAFRGGTGERVRQSLPNLRRAAGKDGLAALVLDLRGNPGGEVDEALVVADMFIADGILMRTRGRGGTILREERAHSVGTDSDLPLVVLQDRHSASAAELLAVALKEHGRAKVIGERSFGKGTVQDVIGMEDGSVLTLTVARYFSPKDNTVDRVGVEPDVLVTLPTAQARRSGGTDPGVDAALRQILGN